MLRLRWVLLLAAAGLAAWIALYPSDWQFWLGFDRKAYFVTGSNYAFFSGFGAMAMTGLGLSTVAITLIRHLNCHVAGCPRISKHKIAGGEYGVCGKHWRIVNGHPDGHKYTVGHIRERHRLHLRRDHHDG